HLHFNDDLFLCAPKRLATRERDGFSASLENSRDRLRGVRDQRRKDRSDRARDSSCRVSYGGTAIQAYGNCGQMSGSSDPYLRNQHPKSGGIGLLEMTDQGGRSGGL